MFVTSRTFISSDVGSSKKQKEYHLENIIGSRGTQNSEKLKKHKASIIGGPRPNNLTTIKNQKSVLSEYISYFIGEGFTK